MCQKEERMHHAKILEKDGLSQREIANRIGVSDRMVRKYLKLDATNKKTKPRKSKLDPYKDIINNVLEETPFFNLEILKERLQAQGYSGSMTILRDYAREARKTSITKAVIRFETEPGQQAQVDWKECGRYMINGQDRKIYAFVMILGYSRKPFVIFTRDMKSSTLLQAHLEAFAFFNGIPKEILYDNMKTAWIYSNSEWRVNSTLLSLASNCGFKPLRCQVRRPKTKGKVERFIGFLAYNFLLKAVNAKCTSLDELNSLVMNWLGEIDKRQLGQFRETRLARFKKEQGFLRSYVAKNAPDVREKVDLIVSREGLIRYETNDYSVPADYIGMNIIMKKDALKNVAELFCQNNLIRTFALFEKGSHQKNIRKEDTGSLLQRWKKENKPVLSLVRKKEKLQEKPAQADRGFIVDSEHLSIFDLIIEACL